MSDDTSIPIEQGKRIQESLDAVLGSLTVVMNTLSPIEKATTDLLKNTTEIKDILLHYHNSHLHPNIHDGEDNYTKAVGLAFVPTPTTPVDKLLHEYNTDYDVDLNGMIYGKDFKLSGNIPRALKFINDELTNIKKSLTMDEYIKSVPNSDKIWSR